MYKAVDEHGNIHAVNYLVYNKKEVFYLLSGADPEYRNLGGQNLILWEAIKHFHDKVDIFNFKGSMVEGVESSFRNYGGVNVPCYRIYKNFSIVYKTREFLKDLLGRN